jgi:poly(A) polymerase
LLLRYSRSSSGHVIRKARIYTLAEHGIRADMIDPDAVWTVRRLAEAGHRAYVVGGAIRDLLLGKKPKDFDVATDAQPNRIRRLFRRSRIIGRRFRLVHVYFEGGKILEVSTFRAAGEASDGNNIYGTLAEDVMRRDYSMNALFYDPVKEQLIDYVDGLRDIRRRRLRILSPPRTSFAEDPVRMLRAVKYAAPHRLKIPLPIRRAIRRQRASLLECSADRLTEEFSKIAASGHSETILRLARKLGIFDVLFPAVAAKLSSPAAEEELFARLGELDKRGDADRIAVVLALFGDVAREAAKPEEATIVSFQAALKGAATPLRLPNRDTLEAAHRVIGRRHGRVGAHEAGGGRGEAGTGGGRRRRGRGGARSRQQAAATGGRHAPADGERAGEETQAGAPGGQPTREPAAPGEGGESRPRRRRRRRRRGGQRSVDMRASKESTFSP